LAVLSINRVLQEQCQVKGGGGMRGRRLDKFLINKEKLREKGKEKREKNRRQ
jgi:hypothetical protein